MKGILRLVTALALLAGIAGESAAQSLPSDKVPASVREAFRAKFPRVKEVEWKLKSDKNYEAEFKLKNAEVAAKFDDQGKWLETETAVEQSVLPKNVLAAISSEYKGYKIIETQTVERAGDKPLLYEVHVENTDQILKVQLEANGAIVSKVAKRKSAP